MTAEQLQQFLDEQIRPAPALGVKVVRADDTGVTLEAPLDLNANDKGSAFAGSLSSLAQLAGWAVVQSLVGFEGPCRVAIGRSTIDFKQPVYRDLRASAEKPPPAETEAFLAKLREKGRARIEISGILGADAENPAGTFLGAYVAFREEGGDGMLE